MSTVTIGASQNLMYGHHTDIGKRPNQEDRCALTDFETADGRPATLAMVADGIGGHNTGEIASNMAKSMIPGLLLGNPPSASEITRRLKTILEETGQAIYTASVDDPNRSGMGTTCTAIVVADKRLYLAHAGDSRAYLLRNGQLRQLTIDHTWSEEAIRKGRSPEEIRVNPNRGVIMRYLGIDPSITIDTRYRTNDTETADTLVAPLFLEPGDTLLLCTDGVSDSVEPRLMVDYLARADCQAAAEGLVNAALKAGATDNVTALVLRLPGGTAALAAPPRKRMNVLPLLLAALALVAVGAVAAVVLMNRGQSQAAVQPGVTAAATVQSAVAAPAVTPTAAGSGGVQVATVEAAPEASPTLLATLPAATETVTLTAAITATATLSDTLPSSGEPTIIPTKTTEPTATPRLRATATPRTGGTAARATVPAAGAAAGGVILDKPAENATISGQTTFAWQPTAGFVLPPNEVYELVFWLPGQDGFRDGRSPVGANRQTSITFDTAGLDFPPGKLMWGVRLWGATGAVRMLSDGRAFTYEKPGGGNNEPVDPGCEGDACRKRGP